MVRTLKIFFSLGLILFIQSVSLTQYVVLSVCLSVRLFQLASELSRDIVDRRCSDYCPHGAIFTHRAPQNKSFFS